jgi:chromosome segregation ATPase
MESQNYKQSLSSQALIEAKNEIETLQKCIEDKDNLLTQLSEKVNAISTEYIGLKTSYEMSRQKEEESAKVVKSLMSDAEELRKQASMNGSVNISSPDSDVEVKVQEVRLELEETYGKQITVMKEELSKHYQAQIETLSCELNNVKQVCATLENQQEILQQEKQTLTTCNETYTLVVSELETKLAEVNSRLDEVQNEKEEILKLNETLNKQINVINKQDVQFENENRHHEEQVLLTRKEIVSEEVEKINSITELNEKNLKLSTELENLRTEYVEAKKLIDNLQKKGKGGRSQQFQVDSQEIVMELKQVTEQYEEALVNIAMMQARIEDYDIKCENLNDDLLKLKEKYVKTDEAMKNNEERLKEYEEKQESMVLEKQEMMEKWKNAQRQCEEYRDKFVEYEQQLTDYEGLMIQFNELQHECNVYQTHNDELNNKMNIQQDVVVELKAELEVLTNQNQAYQEQALLQTQQLGEISQENKSLQESVNQHKDELTTLTNSFNLVTAEVDVYREKANSLETMVENLNKELQMKGDAEFESKQKDVLIQELTSKISDLTSALKSDHDHLHKETVLHEECSMQKEVSLHEESLAPLSNEECLSALENQIIATDNVQNQSDEIDSRNIDKSGGMLQPVQIIQLEASVTSSEVPFNLIGHQEINEHQSELQLGAGMEVGRDMDADSLDDNESTRTIDSIEDSSHRRNDLMIRISDLHGQNQSLVSDYKTLSDENLELKMNIQKLNDELVEMSGSKSDFEQIVQTFKSIIDKMEAEKEEMEISWKSTEECNLALSEKLKYEESNLTVVEEEKMALQSELTFMNSIINEISQTEDVSQDDALLGALHVDEGLSQTASTSHVDEGLSQTASTNMCNKLQTVKQNVNTLHQECDQLKVEILEINEIHRNELLQRQEENDNLRKELGWLEHQINDLKADEEKSKESQTTEIKILQTENDNLNQKLVEMGEREQNLRVQVDRLSQQVFELSVINQTVSGDKENLENRFVEVSAKESDALEGEVISLSGDCQVLSSTISHDLFVANQQIFPVAGKDVNDLNEKIDREVSGEMETQTNGEKDTASLDGSVNLKVVTTSLSAGSLETLSTSTADQSTDQSTTVRSTCMPTNLGQVMNVCSSVSVKSVNQLPPNYVHGLVASDAFNGKMVDNHDCQTNDCKQAENLDQKEFEKSLNLSNVTEESSFQSCSETFDQMLQVDSIERSNDNMCSAVQNGVGISEISQTTDDGNPSQYLDQVENENENNERSEHLRNENTILKVKLEDTQNDMSEMLNDRVELVGSMENFSDKINSLRSHNEQLSHDLLRAIDENKLLRKQLIENGENSEIRCKLEDKIIELVTENQKLKAEYAKTQTLFKEEHESVKSDISSWK